MNEMPPGGYTGEWIVRVAGITSPEEARRTWDLLHEAIEELNVLLDNRVKVSFDESRWQDNDF